MTPRERLLFLLTALFCGATRFLTMARTHWGWDEALFATAMRDYDVTRHHPHPPGFPVFVGAAKLVRLVVPSDFRALQAIDLLAGVLLFPAVYLLARELGFRFPTATIAGALCAFFPNVWFFGGTALSDVPSIVLATLAAAMLLRGRRDANAYFIGTVALALAIGIRPQNFLIGLFPGLIATWHRARHSMRDVIFAAALGTAISLGAFACAAIATGDSDAYMRTVRSHGEYISRVDSYRSPDRPPLWRLFPRFFLQQYQSAPLSVVVSLFVLISVVEGVRRRDRTILFALLTFGPVAVMAWLMLDRFSINRFSIGYAPLFALLAADGIARAARRFEPYAGAALIGAFIVWAGPAFDVVRNEKSPPVLAIETMQKTLDPARDALYVSHSMSAHVHLLAPGLPYVKVREERSLPLVAHGRRAWILSEIDHAEPRGFVYRREHDNLFSITRRYYYDVALRPLDERPHFVSGWGEIDRFGTSEARMMSPRSVTQLPRLAGDAKLALTVESWTAAKVTITLNGTVVDTLDVSGEVTREWDVIARGDDVLELSTTGPSLKVRDLVWGRRQKP